MATDTTATTARKRLLDESTEPNSLSAKKQKAPDGSPLQPSSAAKTASAASDIIAKARAIAREKALQAAKNIAIKRQAATVAAVAPTPATAPAAPAKSNESPINMAELLAEIAAKKARVAAALAGRKAQSPGPPPPLQNSSLLRNDGYDSKAHGGLNVGVHPALLETAKSAALTKADKKQAMTPKFSSTVANSRKQLEILTGPSKDEIDPAKNPYFDPNIEARPKERNRRTLHFVEHGKYIEQANEIRAQAHLEELKKRIQESSKKAGLDEELEMSDIALKRDEPPIVEWWDQGLLSNQTYDDLDDESAIKLDTADSIITIYVQHPIPIAPPWNKNEVVIRPPHLTKKEMKRIRKVERAERHKDKQDRIRLGLDPAPPPKVKLSNLMNVLTNEAIKDPTLVEARVRREMEERKNKHIQDNEDRKLTSEQKHERLKQKLAQDEKRGIFCAAFRISNLSSPQHFFKINVNARELELKGVCVTNPKFNVIVVEGGLRAITLYKKLLLNRMDWTAASNETTADKVVSSPSAGDGSDGAASSAPLISSAADWSANKCEVIWEGELKQHQFRWWNTRNTKTEAEAREILDKQQVGHFWNLAKNWKSDLL
ncbi:pre-mRNA processing factor 3-domain-containing protein [Limtongia smithiae]|uniref:pre-mRNA processing factor 3-domain-containing protein n=1 Tax=Limtongia smithiae TaxID=1125753 RepID=UPI0034D0121A